MQEFLKSKVMENRTIVRLKSSTETSRGQLFKPDQAQLTDIENLQKTLDLQQNVQIWAAADLICKAKRIHAAGWKASLSVSGFLAYSLHFMLGNCSLIQQGDVAERVAVLEPGDLFFGGGVSKIFPYSAEGGRNGQAARGPNRGYHGQSDFSVLPICGCVAFLQLHLRTGSWILTRPRCRSATA